MRDLYGAIESVVERLEDAKPTNEGNAIEEAYMALDQYIDDALIYTADILELWDGGTHEDLDLGSYDDLMEAITASTFFQLREDWGDAILDGIDEYIGETDLDRDEALEAKNG